jgi:hypothetical protein
MLHPYQSIASAVAVHGLSLRGGFAVSNHDDVPDVETGQPARTVLIIGNAGDAMWPVFAAARPEGSHPLDRWTRNIIEPIAAEFCARAVYPFETPPLPFQRWASRAWPLHPSPIGLLIDHEYGLWHALRAALLFSAEIALPAHPQTRSPCETCRAKPCLTACPIGAFTDRGFDYQSCRAYLATPAAGACRSLGCRARNACPVGETHRFEPAQQAFHQRSFAGLPDA